MLWSEIRTAYPDQWLIVEALVAHSTSDCYRSLEQMSVIEAVPDGSAALRRYRQLHQEFPQREIYFVHTSRETLDIRERYWAGIRPGYATVPEK